MLQITSSSDSIIGIHVSGQLTGDDMERAIAAVEAGLQNHERLSFYAEVDPSIRFTAAGFFKDLQYGFSKLRDLKRFYRAAVITDSKWLATIARVEGILFAQIEIKVFPTNEREDAIIWASQSASPKVSPDVLPKTHPAIRIFATDQPTSDCLKPVCRRSGVPMRCSL